MYICKYICKYVNIFVYVNIYIYMYILMSILVLILIHIQSYTYIFTNMRWVSSWQGLHVHLCLLCGSLDRRQLQRLWMQNPAPDHP